MSLCILSERCKKIMQFLLREQDFVPMKKIVEITGVSRRSIYYDICNINEWLDEHGIRELEVERGKGILIPQADRAKIEESLEEKQQEDYFVFLPSERVKIIICYIIHSKEPVYVEQIMEACQVSRNTVFGDTKAVTQKFQEYGLELQYESKKGYRAAGDAIRARALFFLYFNTLRPLFDSGVLKFFNRDEIQGNYEQMYSLQKDVIVSQTLYYGPHMFITDNIMLAHAKPEDGVNKMDISMAVFKNPVFFKEGKKAEIIFVLAAEDHEKHLKILNDILKIAENAEETERLANAGTCEKILQELREILAG
ncbi:MAG: PTS sugar transporter subunit IIA [Eubacterium sp.]|nr:PTS sugar transporter subunit IIA [Eubacterium sp.]